MFGPMKDVMSQFQMVQRLMHNENFKAFIAHPKVQALFHDPEFKEVAKTKDFSKIMAHPKFANLTRDPEVASLMAKINPQDLMGK
ncbi:MAG: hypothetical protein A3C47_02830 [Omnitrophica bacterium RIFCSPHIGHO2_02_FULL_51_18]|nr:MAG: hypothetical protein A3C47_02830 [Omnitrophica bacterium RIFCSPHIGHO2_02_FULL_51_18]